MMDLQTSKNLGGAGALLLFVGPLLSFAYSPAGLISLIGFILVLVALKSFADYYNDAGIFNNALYGFITTIVGIVSALGAFIATALNVVADLGITDWTDATEWTEVMTAETAFDSILELLGGIIIAIVILFAFAILTALLYRKSLGTLASKSGVGLFGTAGLLLLIGAVLTIIVIGFLLIWISFLLIAIAFFSVKPTAVEPPTSSP